MNVDWRNAMFELNFIVIFLGGLFSFFAPCILPVLPLYFGYLSAGAKTVHEDGTEEYHRKKLFLMTLSFVFGICTTFFILGFSFFFVGNFFVDYRNLLAFISGIVIVFFGLFQLGILHSSFFQKERSLKQIIHPNQLTYFSAYLLGFTFSFAWTPCVGPALSSVLLLVANSSKMVGFLYMIVYSVGFIIPFFILGLFTTSVLQFVKKNQARIQKVTNYSGLLILVIGLSFMYQNGSKLIQNFGKKTDSLLVFSDQFGNDHSLDQYRGKMIVLSFLDRGCVACQEEMPIIEELYQTYQKNQKEVVVLGIIKIDAYDTKERVKDFFETNGYHFPVLYDQTEQLKTKYHIKAFPSTVVLDKNGSILEDIVGSVSKDYLLNIIQKQQKNHSCEKEAC